MEILPRLFHVAADAECLQVADQPGIFGTGLIFIRQFGVAVQTGVFYFFLLGIQLPVRVVPLVAFNIMTSKTYARFGFKRSAAQEILILEKRSVELPVLALDDEVMAGSADYLSILQRILTRHPIDHFARRPAVDRVNITV